MENAVRVYLVGDGVDQPLGWVRPSGRAMLAVPRDMVDDAESYRLLVVPVGVPDPGGLPLDASALGIRSFKLPIADLLRLHWLLLDTGIRPRLGG